MIQYSHTDVVEDDSVFSIHILILQKMIQYLHSEVAKDDPILIDDSIFTYWGCRRWSSIFILRLMMKMHDVVPKIYMTYIDSPDSCTVVMMVVVDVEYLPSKEGVLKYCNF